MGRSLWTPGFLINTTSNFSFFFFYKIVFSSCILSGKPRIISTGHIGKIMFRNQTETIAFDIISNPVPHQSNVWFLGAMPNSSSSCELKEKSAMNITCTSYTDRKYLVKCTLTVFNILPCSGFFMVQVINIHGDENFTVEIIYSRLKFYKSLICASISQSVHKVAEYISSISSLSLPVPSDPINSFYWLFCK